METIEKINLSFHIDHRELLLIKSRARLPLPTYNPIEDIPTGYWHSEILKGSLPANSFYRRSTCNKIVDGKHSEICKTKEFHAIQKQINNKRKEQESKLKQNKIDSYSSLLDSFLNNELDNTQIPSYIKNKLNKKPQEKSNSEVLTYACVKLEALAGIDSLKRDSQLRQSVQMEMLTNKFNKVSDSLNSVDDLLVHFVNNISAKPSAAEKTLWKRITKTIEILV